ncbi:MAG: hypothetical protein QG555_1191 [Thermodesulfobacteriota bacterium]|nr:hypothetical protein [Thermodesulfobacteriota bacterium]
MLGHDGNDHGGILGSLALVDRHRIGRDQLIEVPIVIRDQPLLKKNLNVPFGDG